MYMSMIALLMLQYLNNNTTKRFIGKLTNGYRIAKQFFRWEFLFAFMSYVNY